MKDLFITCSCQSEILRVTEKEFKKLSDYAKT